MDRIMFGSDQMIWTYAIEKSILFLNTLTFLTRQDKEDIFYNNAARFLKLKNNLPVVGVPVSASFFHSSSQQQPKNINAFIYSVQLTIGNH